MCFVLCVFQGSTDFGNVTFVVPGIHPYFFIESDTLNHIKQYTESAGSQEAQFHTLGVAKALAMMNWMLFLNQGCWKKSERTLN